MKLPSLPEGEITAIEIHRANPYVELGISVVGGNETPLINIVIQEVYRDGVIARDGRLLAGDQILQVKNNNYLGCFWASIELLGPLWLLFHNIRLTVAVMVECSPYYCVI